MVVFGICFVLLFCFFCFFCFFVAAAAAGVGVFGLVFGFVVDKLNWAMLYLFSV